MLVHQILKSKSSSGVQSVHAVTKVKDVARLLEKHRIGTVVVSEDGKSADGILSERDIVRALAKSGSSCLERSVGDYMTRKLVTCTPQNSS
ncbi:MAG: CBS domain-containing protein, partial [Rhodobacteraceae bacterium]|nr:CBS domain-containing protein [Paracoccaceae bacterium]